MNWARKQANLEKERRGPKPVKKMAVVINSPDPKKEFMTLPIYVDWHTIDNVPVLLVICPHERYEDIRQAYYTAIRRNINGYAWHVDNKKIINELQDHDMNDLLCHSLHCWAMDPDRVTMSQLMRCIPAFHKLAHDVFITQLATERANREAERAHHNSTRGNPFYWTSAGNATWTTSYGTATNVTIAGTSWYSTSS